MTSVREPDPATARPLPVVDERNAPFWTGGADGRLRMQRCGACRRVVHPPALLCPHDHSPELAWEALSGRAEVETWTEAVHPLLPGFPNTTLIALVAIDEDRTARVLTNLVDVDAERVEVGMPVEVVFEHHHVEDGPDVYLPLFRPLEEE
jgi:uncharacterized OB-fold protein